MTATNRCRAFVGFSLLMHVFACEAASDRHGFVDQPEPVPAGEFAGEDVLERNEPKVEPVDPSECGPRSGKMPNGTCIRLRVRETPHVQQVQIPAGTFVMGRIPDNYNAESTREQPSVRWSGQPPRPVAVASFWIDLHEVSRGAYRECVEKGACTQVACPAGVNDPVAEQSSELAAVFPQTCVSHAQAEQYCRAQGHRLPTEAEWEYAARGVDARRFPWGNEVLERLPDGLYPVGRVRSDQSYFGILGMGTDALEWVAERYDPEAALRPFLKRDFRQPNGPTGAARAKFEREAHCGESPAPGCMVPELERHVIKSTVVGARRGVRVLDPPQLGSHELEGWPTARVRDQLGFRCASDVVPTEEEPSLQVPERAPVVPIFRSTGTFQVFGGIAEAVSLAEAKAFCEALIVPFGTGSLEDWRLPSVSEVEAMSDVFRGPGPFWVADGAVTQHLEGVSDIDPEAPWRAIDVPATSALAARCIRPAEAPVRVGKGEQTPDKPVPQTEPSLPKKQPPGVSEKPPSTAEDMPDGEPASDPKADAPG